MNNQTDFEKYAAIYDVTRTYEEILYSTDGYSTPLAEIASFMGSDVPEPKDGYVSNGIFIQTNDYHDDSGFDIIALYLETAEARKERLEDGYNEFLKRDLELRQAIEKRQSMDEKMIEKEEMRMLNTLAHKYNMKVEGK
jgi:hypothetical protein